MRTGTLLILAVLSLAQASVACSQNTTLDVDATVATATPTQAAPLTSMSLLLPSISGGGYHIFYKR